MMSACCSSPDHGTAEDLRMPYLPTVLNGAACELRQISIISVLDVEGGNELPEFYYKSAVLFSLKLLQEFMDLL